jgi:hypothetical protein
MVAYLHEEELVSATRVLPGLCKVANTRVQAHRNPAAHTHRCCVRVTSASKEKNRPRPAPAGLNASLSSAA